MTNRTKRRSAVDLWLRIPSPLPRSAYQIAADTGIPYSSVARVVAGKVAVPVRFLTTCSHVYGLSLDAIAIVGPADPLGLRDVLTTEQIVPTRGHLAGTPLTDSPVMDTYERSRSLLSPDRAQLERIAQEFKQTRPWVCLPLRQEDDPEPTVNLSKNPHAKPRPDVGSVEWNWWKVRKMIRKYGEPNEQGYITLTQYSEGLRDGIAASWAAAEGWPDVHPYRQTRQAMIRNHLYRDELPDYQPPTAAQLAEHSDTDDDDDEPYVPTTYPFDLPAATDHSGAGKAVATKATKATKKGKGKDHKTT